MLPLSKKIQRLSILRIDETGFTLIELMIVVAVIGLLVAIAVPQYKKYQRKAHQSEAKLAIGSIYALEKSFYGEYSAYIGSLDAIGYTSEGYRRFYSHEITTDCGGGGTITGYAGTYYVGCYYVVNSPYSTSGAYPGNPAATCGGMAAASYGADPQVFIAIAWGNLSGIWQHDDVWTINESKVLSNCATGI